MGPPTDAVQTKRQSTRDVDLGVSALRCAVDWVQRVRLCADRHWSGYEYQRRRAVIDAGKVAHRRRSM